MIVAIMQPYFFPYIGYFQLMQVADTFVFLDDVQYINRGWVNRNQIPLSGKPVWLTMPVKMASRSLAINERQYLLHDGVAPIKRRLQAAYTGMKHSREWQVIEELLDFPETNTALFNANLLRFLARELAIQCNLLNASDLGIGKHLHGESRIIEICRKLGATHYVNPIGGIGLYDPVNFSKADIQLSFMQTRMNASLTSEGPVHFSIIDRLIRDGISVTRSLLSEFVVQSPYHFAMQCTANSSSY